MNTAATQSAEPTTSQEAATIVERALEAYQTLLYHELRSALLKHEPDNRAAIIGSTLKGSAAQWSGGPLGMSNLREKLLHEVAVLLLNDTQFMRSPRVKPAAIGDRVTLPDGSDGGKVIGVWNMKG